MTKSDALKATNNPEFEPTRPVGSLTAQEQQEIKQVIDRHLIHVKLVQQKPFVGLDAI